MQTAKGNSGSASSTYRLGFGSWAEDAQQIENIENFIFSAKKFLAKWVEDAEHVGIAEYCIFSARRLVAALAEDAAVTERYVICILCTKNQKGSGEPDPSTLYVNVIIP